MSVRQVAADGRGEDAFGPKRAAVEAAGRHFHLRDGAVREKLDGLGARLAAEGGAVRLTVIENIPPAVDLFDAAVVVGGLVETILFPPSRKPDVAVGDDRAAEGKAAVGIAARRVAELMAELRGIDEVVKTPHLADGACLVEGVAFETCALRHELTGQDAPREFVDGEHIVFQGTGDGAHQAAALFPFHLFPRAVKEARFAHEEHLLELFGGNVVPAVGLGGIGRERPAVVEADDAVVVEDGGIGGHKAAERTAVGKADFAQKAIISAGGIGDGDKDAALKIAEAVVKIVFSVVPAHDVGRVEALPLPARLTVGGIDDALIPP